MNSLLLLIFVGFVEVVAVGLDYLLHIHLVDVLEIVVVAAHMDKMIEIVVDMSHFLDQSFVIEMIVVIGAVGLCIQAVVDLLYIPVARHCVFVEVVELH